MECPYDGIFFHKKNEVLIHAITWTEEKNTLTERSQTQNATYCISNYVKCPGQANPQRQKVEQQLPKVVERWRINSGCKWVWGFFCGR